MCLLSDRILLLLGKKWLYNTTKIDSYSIAMKCIFLVTRFCCFLKEIHEMLQYLIPLPWIENLGNTHKK